MVRIYQSVYTALVLYSRVQYSTEHTDSNRKHKWLISRNGEILPVSTPKGCSALCVFILLCVVVLWMIKLYVCYNAHTFIIKYIHRSKLNIYIIK